MTKARNLADNDQILARLRGWQPSYSNSNYDSIRWSVINDALELGNVSDSQIGVAYQAVRIRAGETKRFTVSIKGSASSSSGLYVRLYQHNGDLPDGKTHVSNNGGSVFVQEDDSGDTGWIENSSISTSWVTYERDYTASNTGYVSLVILNWSGNGTDSIYIKTPDIQFLRSDAKAADSELLDGLDSSQFLRSNAKAADSELLDGLNSSQFLRSDANDTVNGTLSLNRIDSRGTEIYIGAGESLSGITGTSEKVYLAGEGGIEVLSSTDNMSSGLNNRATICDSSGNSSFPGNIIPSSNSVYDLGSSSNRWNNVYVNDLNLSNGTGDYTIVEGEEDLFLYNNKSGKVYKFDVTEVNPDNAPPKSRNL